MRHQNARISRDWGNCLRLHVSDEHKSSSMWTGQAEAAEESPATFCHKASSNLYLETKEQNIYRGEEVKK